MKSYRFDLMIRIVDALLTIAHIIIALLLH